MRVLPPLFSSLSGTGFGNRPCNARRFCSRSLRLVISRVRFGDMNFGGRPAAAVGLISADCWVDILALPPVPQMRPSAGQLDRSALPNQSRDLVAVSALIFTLARTGG